MTTDFNCAEAEGRMVAGKIKECVMKMVSGAV
jgi:hypothetical protein